MGKDYICRGLKLERYFEQVPSYRVAGSSEKLQLISYEHIIGIVIQISLMTYPW